MGEMFAGATFVQQGVHDRLVGAGLRRVEAGAVAHALAPCGDACVAGLHAAEGAEGQTGQRLGRAERAFVQEGQYIERQFGDTDLGQRGRFGDQARPAAAQVGHARPMQPIGRSP